MDWEEAWQTESEEQKRERIAHGDVMVFTLAQLILSQLRDAPASKQQAIAALDIAKTVFELR